MRRTLAASLLLASACIDPVHDDAVSALGPEPNGSRPGPTHRPGQPCLVCHGGHGPGSPEFAVAGTVYEVLGSGTGASGAQVDLVDASGATMSAETNDVGNFYILKSQWAPQFPLTVNVSAGGTQATMTTTIGRDGSCNACHKDPGDSSHMPGVYVRAK